jgi:DNA-binding response OmpR family regulator
MRATTVGTAARKATVLIVEDDPSLRSTYRTALAFAGYSVIAVEDGVDALRHLEADTLEAVVLDLGLPRLHGRDVYREMRADPRTRAIPIVIVTGSDPSSLDTTEFDCLLRKPFDPDELVSAVDACVRQALRKQRI